MLRRDHCMESLMRRVLLYMTALATFAAQQAQAQSFSCLTPAERGMFEVQALRSETMVLATGCSDDADYNAFVERYRPELMANEHEIAAWFKRHYGGRGQSMHDAFVTDLADEHSLQGSKLGNQFCPRNGMIFHEVMALPSASQLPAFAEGQDLLPATMTLCREAVARTPARKVVRRVRHVRHN
jgi:hypothetical protein